MQLADSPLAIDGVSGGPAVKMFCVISVSNPSEFPRSIDHLVCVEIKAALRRTGSDEE